MKLTQWPWVDHFLPNYPHRVVVRIKGGRYFTYYTLSPLEEGHKRQPLIPIGLAPTDLNIHGFLSSKLGALLRAASSPLNLTWAVLWILWKAEPLVFRWKLEVVFFGLQRGPWTWLDNFGQFWQTWVAQISVSGGVLGTEHLWIMRATLYNVCSVNLTGIGIFVL